jgi:hypothetical protein
VKTDVHCVNQHQRVAIVPQIARITETAVKILMNGALILSFLHLLESILGAWITMRVTFLKLQTYKEIACMLKM